MSYTRDHTRRIHLGGVPIGGGAPVAVQSMTNTDTRDPAATLAQIEALAEAGCELVRCAVPDMEAAEAFKPITDLSPLPVIADIHFDPRLAVAALDNGAAGMRINPGNIGGQAAVTRVVDAAKAAGAPIRVGANSGSLPKDILERCGGPTPEALVEAALGHVRLLENHGFDQIKVSLKSSGVQTTLAACRLWAERYDYPQHLGITEAGGLLAGAVKSAAGLGALLMEGMGDTFRISLTADPVREVEAAWHLLRACGLRSRGVEIVSCPTCGRTEYDLMGLLERAEPELAKISAPLTVAIMGCVVNGPGEAKHADVGVAGGRGQGILFAKGEVIKKLPEADLLDELIKAVQAAAKDYSPSVDSDSER
ncbi:MAG: flavodoxin-dependent (E)-4-hydroxy-3-methylbut-2-enyl-diphosphate synthase [Desulfarculaceae bacterium]|nr:flavodoxin-dependent (E)-4-hydroxy-3-methylbut-2-enyl-diphosphate synthase [Desulfarculaceae bacterium]MCF8072347.1 flavodoxin-dependent (E)-4-hydroxy-3-methylbut-2-enyl-diphosphate synthase [Desulfarculaceae bacterium]MCF8100268.1 flavodoxin-dependent (E)-4-hydroxy-3-methylbut-2-enyl-diphosphate synthase [Desulfarculaceae bacterium]MCF8116159.1 flavodoxin-dependent (E)-4-hydroxy-3-methylbut-2-enyl-diphosphate synthase [Desulfarculaceae bacterium]